MQDRTSAQHRATKRHQEIYDDDQTHLKGDQAEQTERSHIEMIRTSQMN